MFYLIKMFRKVVTVLVLFGVSSILGAPNTSQNVAAERASSTEAAPRIIGGGTTTIYSYPYMTSLIQSTGSAYSQYCAGSILTTTVILTAAQCVADKNLYQYQARVGSSYANSGGVTHQIRQAIVHPSYNRQTLDCDVAILKTAITINYIPNTVASGSIAAASYNLRDNEPVWAIGWGYTSLTGPASELLRHTQIWTVNQAVCRSRYAELGIGLTDNMLCSGWLDVGGRDQCTGDSGGPLLHNNVIVGVCSWGSQCALARYPGVNTRVSRFTSWILSAAA